jgi:hypothetical protein
MALRKDVPQTLVAVLVPLSWKEELTEMAKQRTKVLGQRVTYIDLIRIAAQEKYGLEAWFNGQIVRKNPAPAPTKTKKPAVKKKILIKK